MDADPKKKRAPAARRASSSSHVDEEAAVRREEDGADGEGEGDAQRADAESRVAGAAFARSLERVERAGEAEEGAAPRDAPASQLLDGHAARSCGADDGFSSIGAPAAPPMSQLLDGHAARPGGNDDGFSSIGGASESAAKDSAESVKLPTT